MQQRITLSGYPEIILGHMVISRLRPAQDRQTRAWEVFLFAIGKSLLQRNAAQKSQCDPCTHADRSVRLRTK
jgi:hypothetical protein